MKKVLSLLVLGMFVLPGCTRSIGTMPQTTGTDVSLKEGNYKMIKAGARGESQGFYLLGILPINSPNYADAKADLYRSAGQPLEGRSIALANQTYDHSNTYLILFSLPKITITADIVEFK